MTLRMYSIRCASATASVLPHIPYRGSKLTLVLREAFALESCRPSHTVFLACLSPLAEDQSATINTLRYASSLVYVPSRASLNNNNANPPDPSDVLQWSHEKVIEWLEEEMRGSGSNSSGINTTSVFPYENGRSLAKVPEQEFIKRLIMASNGKMGEKRARGIYLKFWGVVVQCRTKKRTQQRKAWSNSFKERKLQEEAAFARELEERTRRGRLLMGIGCSKYSVKSSSSHKMTSRWS